MYGVSWNDTPFNETSFQSCGLQYEGLLVTIVAIIHDSYYCYAEVKSS